MDEYSPRRHDIAQLKFLSESLYDESLATLAIAIMAGLMILPLLPIYSLTI